MRSLLPTLGVLALAFLTSCTTGGSTVGCIDNGDCGELEACILETCEPVECLDSTQCGIREYCDDETYVCRAGCSADTDCRAGESCDLASNTCEPYGCRSTTLDCNVGEFCSPVTGECLRDRRDHCERCQVDAWLGWMCPSAPSDAVCVSTSEAQQDPQCAYYCDPNRPEDPEAGCPAGFMCEQLLSGEHVCIADCEMLEDRGWY